MKELLTLTEKYFKKVEYSGTEFWVFINPDAKDIKDIQDNPPFENTAEKDIRFGFTKNGDMYAWHYSCLHDKMERLISKTFNIRATMNYDPQLFFSLSYDTSKYYAAQVEPKYVRMRLAKAFPEAKKLIDGFIEELGMVSDKELVKESLQDVLEGYEGWQRR